jgi:hypothetical protein
MICNEIEENAMGWTCGMRGRKEISVQWGNPKERVGFEDVGLDMG